MSDKYRKTHIKEGKCDSIFEENMVSDKHDLGSKHLKRKQGKVCSLRIPVTDTVFDEIESTTNYKKRKKHHMKQLKSVDEFPIFDKPPVDRQKQKAVSVFDVHSAIDDHNISSIKHKKRRKKDYNIIDKRESVFNEEAFQNLKNEQLSLSASFDKSEFNSDSNYKHRKKHKKGNESSFNNMEVHSSVDKSPKNHKIKYDTGTFPLLLKDKNTVCKESQSNSSIKYNSKSKDSQSCVTETSALNESLKITRIKQNAFPSETHADFHNAGISSSHAITKHRNRHEKESNFQSIRTSTPDKSNLFFQEWDLEKTTNKNHLYSTEKSSLFEKPHCTTFTKKIVRKEDEKKKGNNLNISEIPFTHKTDIPTKKSKKKNNNVLIADHNIVYGDPKINFDKNNQESSFSIVGIHTVFEEPNKVIPKCKNMKENKESTLKTAETYNTSNSFEKNSNFKHKKNNSNPSVLNECESEMQKAANIDLHTYKECVLCDETEISSKKHKNTNNYSGSTETNVHGCTSGSGNEDKKSQNTKGSPLYATEGSLVFADTVISSSYKSKHKKKKHRKEIHSHTMEKDTKFNNHELISVVANAEKESYINVAESIGMQDKTEMHPIEVHTYFNEREVSPGDKLKKKHKKKKHRKEIHSNSTENDAKFNNHELISINASEEKGYINAAEGFDVQDKSHLHPIKVHSDFKEYPVKTGDKLKKKHKKKKHKKDIHSHAAESGAEFNNHELISIDASEKKEYINAVEGFDMKDKSDLHLIEVETNFNEYQVCPGYKLKKKKHKKEICSDTTENGAKFNNTELISINASEEKGYMNAAETFNVQDRSDLHPIEVQTNFNEYQVRLGDKLKKKHKKKKHRKDMHSHTAESGAKFNNHELISIDASEEKVGYINAAEGFDVQDKGDLHPTKVQTDFNEYQVRPGDKLKKKHKKKKHRKEICSDTIENSAKFNNTELISINASKEKGYINAAEGFGMEDKSDLHLIEVETNFNECEVCPGDKLKKKNKKQRKEICSDITENGAKFNNTELISINASKEKAYMNAAESFDVQDKSDLHPIEVQTDFNEYHVRLGDKLKKKHKKKKNRKNMHSHTIESGAEFNNHELISINASEEKEGYINAAEGFDMQDKSDLHLIEVETNFNEYQVCPGDKLKKKDKKKKHRKEISLHSTENGADFNNPKLISINASEEKGYMNAAECFDVQDKSDWHPIEVQTDFNEYQVRLGDKVKKKHKEKKHRKDIHSHTAESGAEFNNHEFFSIDASEEKEGVQDKSDLHPIKVQTDFNDYQVRPSDKLKKKHKKKKHKKEMYLHAAENNAKFNNQELISIDAIENKEGYVNSAAGFKVQDKSDLHPIEVHTDFNEYQVRSSNKLKNKHGKKKHRKVIHSHTAESGAENFANEYNISRKHKKDLKKQINCDLPYISEENIINADNLDSAVANNMFKNGRNHLNKIKVGKNKLVGKKYKKEEQNHLCTGEECENDNSAFEFSETHNSLMVSEDILMQNSFALSSNIYVSDLQNQYDSELNFPRDVTKKLVDSEIHFSHPKVPKKCKKLSNDIPKDINHSESSFAHNDIRKYMVKKSAVENASTKDTCDIDLDSNTTETIHFVDNSNRPLENVTDEQNPSSSDEGVEDMHSEILDSTEDPVDFEVPLLHRFEKVGRLNENQKDDLQAAGVFIKGGKYTITENNIIKRNFEDFAKRYGISDPVKLLGIGRYKQDRCLLKFLKAKHFYLRLAKDLNDRTLYGVYRRARMILDPLRNAGKLRNHEILRLKELQKSLSNKWYKISNILGKSAATCMESFKWNNKDVAKGKFTETEKTQLIEAIKKVTGSSDLSCKNMKFISWKTVASYVPTRNYLQCKTFWAYHLGWAAGSARKKWNHDCYCKLAHILKETDVEDSSMIDWYEIYGSFEDFAPSDIFVQRRWLYLRSQVPDYKNKSYKEIVEILCNKYPLS